MKIDYIPAASVARWRKRRVALVAALFASIGFGSLQLLVRSNDAVAGSSSPSAATSSSPRMHEDGDLARPSTAGSSDFDGIIQTAVTDALKVPEASQWTTVSVKSGQNLSLIFDALGLAHDETAQLLAIGGEVQRLKKLKAGDELHVLVEDDQLEGLKYALDERRSLEVRRGDKGLESVTITAAIEHRQTTASGRITNKMMGTIFSNHADAYVAQCKMK